MKVSVWSIAVLAILFAAGFAELAVSLYDVQVVNVAEFKRDLNTMHFYIPEEKKYAAEIRFEDKGANFGVLIVVIIAALLLCAFICYFLPDLLKMIDNFISITKGN